MALTFMRKMLMGLILMGAMAGVAVAEGECSKSNPCKGGECCSQFGFCGCTERYCGAGCIDNCNGCAGRRENAHTLLNPNEGECSKSNPCKGGECCSQFGFCGCTEPYCGAGCIDNCNGCSSNRALTADSGQATYYTTYVPSSCYGFDTKPFPAGNMIAAASSDVFGNRAACGTYYEITCKGAASGGRNPCKKNPTVKVMVVDLCPGCNKNSFDLSQEAFSKIADLDAGRINISAKRVSKYHKTNEEDIVEVV